MCKGWAVRLLNRVALCAPLLMPAQNASADTAWVAANALNLRSGPGTEYARVATLSACTRVDVVGYANGWAMVRRGGKDYWVAGNYLSVAPCNTAPQIPVYRVIRPEHVNKPPRSIAPQYLNGVFRGY
ncbi:SH3 domain-containing protein [Sagittula salina]|uniref:SH3 domain-containing protein n=1 Tax=Sagittula salina TaxID=2820268 RepID=A0A940S1C4_9RHOB|nr:SH3 domain-containing protein [Sagittula salina]MBP0482912.1 SH3 domain-containing protein [Sagittula salina]